MLQNRLSLFNPHWIAFSISKVWFFCQVPGMDTTFGMNIVSAVFVRKDTYLLLFSPCIVFSLPIAFWFKFWFHVLTPSLQKLCCLILGFRRSHRRQGLARSLLDRIFSVYPRYLNIFVFLWDKNILWWWSWIMIMVLKYREVPKITLYLSLNSKVALTRTDTMSLSLTSDQG